MPRQWIKLNNSLFRTKSSLVRFDTKINGIQNMFLHIIFVSITKYDHCDHRWPATKHIYNITFAFHMHETWSLTTIGHQALSILICVIKFNNGHMANDRIDNNKNVASLRFPLITDHNSTRKNWTSSKWKRRVEEKEEKTSFECVSI